MPEFEEPKLDNQQSVGYQYNNPNVFNYSSPDRGRNILKYMQENYRGPQRTTADIEDMDRIQGLVDPINKDLAEERFEAQPWYSTLGAAVNQAIVGEIGGGTIEGLGYLLDLEQYSNLAKGTEQEFGNWLSDIGKDVRTWSQDTTTIYTDPNKQGGFNPEDWTWWMDNAQSVASTLSLMVPSGLAVKGASALGNALGVSAKLGKGAKWAMKGVAQAVASRHMENLMEANGVVEELKGLAGQQITADQVQAIKDNYGVDIMPSRFDDSGNAIYELSEQAATEMAAKAGSNIYKANSAMLIQDIPQYLMLNAPFGKATEKLTTGMAKKLGKDVVPVVANNLTNIGKTMLSEGGEEAYQYIVSEAAREFAMADAGLADKRSLSAAISDYATRGEMLTSAFWGAAGGGFMQVAGRPVNNAITKVKGLQTEEERRIDNIESTGKKMQMYNDIIQSAESAGNTALFNHAKEQQLIDLSVNAAKNGNLQYLVDALSGVESMSEQEQQAFGITPDQVEYAKKVNPTLIQDIQRIGELYDQNSAKHGVELGSLIAREDFSIEKINSQLGDINRNISSTISSIPNIGKLSINGRQLIEDKANLSAQYKILDVLNKRLSNVKDADEIASIQNDIKDVSSKKDLLIKKISETEEVADDKNVNTTSPALEEYQKLVDKKAFAEFGLSKAQQNSAKLKNPSYQAKATKKAQSVEKQQITEIISSGTPEDISEISKRGKKVGKSDLVEKTINEVANTQAPVISEGDVLVDVLGADEAIQQEKTPVSTFAQDRYNNKAALFHQELNGMIAAAEDVRDLDPEIVKAIGELELLVKTPAQLDLWIDDNKERISAGKNLIPLMNRVAGYIKSKDTITQSTTSAKQSEVSRGSIVEKPNVSETNSSTSTDIITPRSTSPVTRSKSGKVTALYVKPIPNTVNFLAVNLPTYVKGLDVNGLDNLDYKVGDKIWFEVDKSDEYAKQDKDARGIFMITYLDGNSENKDTANRKIVGKIPSTKTDAGVADLRDKINLDINSKYETPGNIVTSKYTSEVIGHKAPISQSKVRQNPLDVIPSSELQRNKEVGGFYIGITESPAGKVGLNFRNSELPFIDGVSTKNAGEIIIGVQNPLYPEILILRAFKKKLSEYSKTNKDNAEKVRNRIITTLKKLNPDGSNFAEIKNSVNEVMYLDFNYNPSIQTIILDGKYRITIDELNSDKLDNLNYYLNDSYFNIDKTKVNLERATVDFGFGIQRNIPYNKFIADFLELDITPQRYFEGVSLLVDVNIKTDAEKASESSDNAKVVGVSKQIISDHKDSIIEELSTPVQKSVVSDQADSSESIIISPSKRARKSFDVDINGKFDDLLNDINTSSKFKLSSEIDYKKWNRSQEEAWLRSNLPNVPVKDINDILPLMSELIQKGQQAWGAAYNGSIYMYENAGVGTLFHEAFHIVFDGVLTDKQKASLLKDAVGNTIKEKEEWLADEFAEYIVTQTESSSWSKSIRDFFRKLLLMIKSLYSNEITGIDEFAFRVNNGMYKSHKSFNGFNDPKAKTKIAGWSALMTKQAVDAVNKHLIMSIIPSIRESNKEFTNMSDAEVMGTYARIKGNDYLYKVVYNDFLKVAESSSEEIAGNLYQVADMLLNEDGSIGKLFDECIRSLDYNNGIKVTQRKIDSVNDNKNDDDVLDHQEDDARENWMSSYEQRSSKATAPYEVKNFIRYMKTGEKNWLGLPEYVDYDATYNKLLNELADSTSIDEMLTYLDESILFSPELIQIKDKMQSDPVFSAKVFNTFSKAHVKFTMLTSKKDSNGNVSYIYMDANRRGVVKSIVTDWANSVLVNSSVVVLENNGDYSIDSDKAKKILDQFNSINFTKGVTNEDIELLSKITSDLGFEISTTVFKYIIDNKLENKLLTGERSLRSIITKFSEGKNPFDQEAGLESSEQNAINDLAKVVKKATPALFESSFKNIAGDTVYSHLVPTYLSKLVARLHNPATSRDLINSFQRDKLFKSNYILNRMYNYKTASQLEDTFDYALLNGISDEQGDKSYPDMKNADLQVLALNSYYNNGNKTYSNYRGPVLSDAGNMIMMKFIRLGSNEVIEEMIALGSAEYDRIKSLELLGGKGIKNYDNKINKSTESGYHIMPMFNGFEGDPALNPELAKKTIVKWFSDEINSYKESLVSNKVISLNTDGSVNYKESRLDSRIGNQNFDKFLADFMYNDYLFRANFSLITVGDPAFYKADASGNKLVDFTKRAKEILSPKMIPLVDGKDGIYKTIYLKDSEIQAPSYSDIESSIDKAVGNGIIDSNAALVIKAAYEQVNHTDAQAYISLPFYKKTMEAYGRWTDKHESAYGRLMYGKGTASDIALVMQPNKPFMYTQIHNPEIGRMVPVQNKNSEFLLLPQLFKDGKNVTLKKLHDFMIDKNIGVANFESAVKTGLHGVATVDTLDQAVLHEIPMEDRGIQMETPEHFIDSDNLFGSQIRKLIVSDLTEGVDYVIGKDGKNQPITMKAKQLYSLYESLIIADLKESYQEALDEFTVDGKINWRKIHELLLDESRGRGKGAEFEKAIAYDEANDRLILPLFHPLYASTAENILTSIFKNRVTKQKITGGAFIQASSYGLTNALKLVFNEDGGLDHAQVLLPAWSKKFYKDFSNEDGVIDFEKVKESAPELLDMIGYRIPTEDKYSMLPLKVIGFLPLESGGAIMLPAEITKIAGSDFDVDKMYVMMKAFVRNEDGTYEAVKYDNSKEPSEQSKEARDNAKIDLMLGVLRNQHTLQSIMTPGGFDYLQNSIAPAILSKSTGKTKFTSIFGISSMDEMSVRNMTGKQLVGIAANHNAHHALRQHFDLELKNFISFDGLSLTKLGQKKAQSQYEVIEKDGKFSIKRSEVVSKNITRNISEFLAAVVDNAKDPVAAFINYNTYTADTISLIVGLGFDPLTAISFATQPIIIELTNRIMSDKSKSEFTVINELAKSIGIDNIDDLDAVNLDTESLFKAIGSDNLATGLQKDVLVAWANYSKQAKGLGKLIRASRADTKGLGPTIADGESIISSVNDLIGDENFPIKGVDKMFNMNGESDLIAAFTIIGIEKPMNEVMNEILPYNNRLFSDIKDRINANIPNKDLSVDQRNMINKQIVSFYLSGFDYFNADERNYIVNDLPKAFNDFVKSIPASSPLKKNSLLKHLKFEAKDKRVPINRIVFFNTGSLTDEQRVDIQNAWEDLLDSAKSDSTTRKIAHDLIKYTYFGSGLNFTANSFAHLIPVDAYLNSIRDPKGYTSNSYLHRLIDIQNNSDISEIARNFVDQFYRNNYKKTSFVPRIDSENTNIDSISDNKEVVLIDPKSKKTDLVIKQGQSITAIPFIAKDLDNTIILYKFAGTDSNGYFRYEKTSKLGVPNYVIEYNMNMNSFESVIDGNNFNIKSNANSISNNSESTTKEVIAQKIDIPSNDSASEIMNKCKGK